MKKHFLVLVFLTHSLFSMQKDTNPNIIQEDISPTEDLMREHGILNRLLLIYEEIVQRISESVTFPLSSLAQAIIIAHVFIENYHEKLEEEHIFPLFENHHTEISLVTTLRMQHEKGRNITAQLSKIVSGKENLSKNDLFLIKTLLSDYITMFRPHEAREDTVLFPKVRSLITHAAFLRLGELFEEKEHELFGDHGFESFVDKIARIEQQLGIYNLEKFTVGS